MAEYHTDDKLEFFLCEIKLFQIGDSQIAPAFTVVERPNDWTKKSEKTASANSTQQQRLEYWQAFNVMRLVMQIFQDF